jgi:hypothetical protein
MDAAGRSSVGGQRGAPRLLEHCEAFERMLGDNASSARVRVETMLGEELAGLLYRALLPGPRPAFVATF